MNDVITLGQINNLKKTRDKKTLLLLIHVLKCNYSLIYGKTDNAFKQVYNDLYGT